MTLPHIPPISTRKADFLVPIGPSSEHVMSLDSIVKVNQESVQFANLAEGDIDLPPTPTESVPEVIPTDIPLNSNNDSSVLKKKVRGGVCIRGCNRWGDSPGSSTIHNIPIQIAEDYSPEERNDVLLWALGYIETGSNIRFVKYLGQQSYLVIQDGNRCSSFVGRIVNKGPQIITLARKGCMSRGTAVHEITHALGIDHEHQRPDRISYLRVQTENVNQEEVNQVALDPNLDSGTITPYDYASIMHYQRGAFSRNGKPVLTPIDKSYTAMLDFKRSLYSSCDWQELFYLYSGPYKPPPCTPHVLGRGLQPSQICLQLFTAQECDLVCTFDTEVFWKHGFCTAIGGGPFPPNPDKLPRLQTGVDADLDGEKLRIITKVRGAVGISGSQIRCAKVSSYVLGIGIYLVLKLDYVIVIVLSSWRSALHP